jgi:carbon-monoxide dehydrogenase small subunit
VILEFTLNGGEQSIEIAPTATLLEVLREDLLLTGAKEGCGVGECGTCLVLIDGAAVPSCLVLAGDAAGTEVETVEGLADGARLDPVQQAFVAAGAVQCGFCTPGMVMAAEAYVRAHPEPDREEALRAMSGVLCRCGSYSRVVRAVEALIAGGGR